MPPQSIVRDAKELLSLLTFLYFTGRAALFIIDKRIALKM